MTTLILVGGTVLVLILLVGWLGLCVLAADAAMTRATTRSDLERER